MKKGSLAQGVILALIGLVLLMKVLGVIGASLMSLWPLLLLGLGASCEREGRAHPAARAGSLITGGTLIVYGLMFLACELVGWRLMAYIWPGFLAGPALGMYHCYRATGARGQLINARILGAVALVCALGSAVPMRVLLPFMMIGAGVGLLMSVLRRSR